MKYGVCPKKRNKVLTDCSSDQGLLEIKAKAKAIKQVHGLDVIIIDHLTLRRFGLLLNYITIDN